MDKKYLVYMHKNKMNSKVYIGITCQKTTYRWGAGSGYKQQPKFYRAICKYGWENFEHIILFDNLDFEKAKQKEIEMIKKYNAFTKKYGYNATKGGDGSNGVPCSDEKKKKISRANKGHKFTDEAKKKISESLKGRKAHNSLKVLCLETGIIYDSMHAAEKETGAKYKNISKVCKGEYGRKTAGGYHWKYYDLDKVEENEGE